MLDHVTGASDSDVNNTSMFYVNSPLFHSGAMSQQPMVEQTSTPIEDAQHGKMNALLTHFVGLDFLVHFELIYDERTED